MKPRLFFIGFNIVLCVLLLGDAFILPAKVKKVTIVELDSKLTRVKRSSYHNYFIYTSDNCEYEISEGLQEILTVNDSIKIVSSPVIGMPLELHYRLNDQNYYSKIGQLNTKQSERIGLMIGLVISVMVFIVQCIKPFKTSSPFFALQLMAFGISMIVFLFVIIEVCSI